MKSVCYKLGTSISDGHNNEDAAKQKIYEEDQ